MATEYWRATSVSRILFLSLNQVFWKLTAVGTNLSGSAKRSYQSISLFFIALFTERLDVVAPEQEIRSETAQLRLLLVTNVLKQPLLLAGKGDLNSLTTAGWLDPTKSQLANAHLEEPESSRDFEVTVLKNFLLVLYPVVAAKELLDDTCGTPLRVDRDSMELVYNALAPLLDTPVIELPFVCAVIKSLETNGGVVEQDLDVSGFEVAARKEDLSAVVDHFWSGHDLRYVSSVDQSLCVTIPQ